MHHKLQAHADIQAVKYMHKITTNKNNINQKNLSAKESVILCSEVLFKEDTYFTSGEIFKCLRSLVD